MTADEPSVIGGEHLPSDDESAMQSSGIIGSACGTDGHCVTCSDEALPARVVHVDPAMELAVVEVGGVILEVDVTLVDEVYIGQRLLVHGGVALASVEDI